jgi:iron complex outermembrane receptor protein
MNQLLSSTALATDVALTHGMQPVIVRTHALSPIVMARRMTLGMICAVLCVVASRVPLIAQNQSVQRLYAVPQSVVVIGSRLPADSAHHRRLVQILERADIERTPARSVEELLETIAGVDVRQRGPMGVQADVSIRGGTFEQTLVLVDGVRMLDPQTGHHAMNIPLTLDDIERIEILKGAASRQYGPNAFAGAINIITRKHRELTARAQAIGGQNGLYELSVSASAPLQVGGAVLGNRLSVSRRRADGYPLTDSVGRLVNRPNTDFDIVTVSAAANLASNAGFSLEATANFIEKKFGANSFYSVRFPNQYEETRTVLAALTARIDNSVGTVGVLAPLVVRAYWRRNQDYFVLRRENPAFYRNDHASNTVGIEAEQTFASALGLSVVGAEVAVDDLNSTNLGKRQRSRVSFIGEHRWKPLESLTVELGATAQYNSDWGVNAAPGLDVGWQISERVSMRGSVGQSFRIPTYTDLYYRDPANIGDSTLVPEQAWTFEIGGEARLPIDWADVRVTAALFQRRAAQLIDFVRSSPADPWRAQNISSAVISGVDIHAVASFSSLGSDGISTEIHASSALRSVIAVERVGLGYTFLSPEFASAAGLQSRYVLDQLRHQGVCTIDFLWGSVVRNQWRLRYDERLGFTGNWFVDTRLSWVWGHGEVFAEGTNLFNHTPTNLDVIGLPIAGRWLRGGVAVNVASLWK